VWWYPPFGEVTNAARLASGPLENGYALNPHITWDDVWTPAKEGDAFIKPALIPKDDQLTKDAAPIYNVRNAYAMWHAYLPENIWCTEFYPLNGKGVATL